MMAAAPPNTRCGNAIADEIATKIERGGRKRRPQPTLHSVSPDFRELAESGYEAGLNIVDELVLPELAMQRAFDRRGLPEWRRLELTAERQRVLGRRP